MSTAMDGCRWTNFSTGGRLAHKGRPWATPDQARHASKVHRHPSRVECLALLVRHRDAVAPLMLGSVQLAIGIVKQVLGRLEGWRQLGHSQ